MTFPHPRPSVVLSRRCCARSAWHRGVQVLPSIPGGGLARRGIPNSGCVTTLINIECGKDCPCKDRNVEVEEDQPNGSYSCPSTRSAILGSSFLAYCRKC